MGSVNGSLCPRFFFLKLGDCVVSFGVQKRTVKVRVRKLGYTGRCGYLISDLLGKDSEQVNPATVNEP
jgi:hypothetical protein